MKRLYDHKNGKYVDVNDLLIKDGKVIKQWKGPKGAKAEKRLYCTEAVATWANDVRPNTFENQFANNPLDIDLNKYYKEKYNGVKA